LNKLDRLYKLLNGTDTAIWAHDEIIKQDKHNAELERDISLLRCVHANEVSKNKSLKLAMQEAVDYDCLPKFTQQRCVQALKGSSQ